MDRQRSRRARLGLAAAAACCLATAAIGPAFAADRTRIATRLARIDPGITWAELSALVDEAVLLDGTTESADETDEVEADETEADETDTRHQEHEHASV